MKVYMEIHEKDHVWTIEEAHTHAKNGFSIAAYTQEDIISGRHAHNFFQVYYVREGSLVHKVKDTSVVLSKGDLFVIAPYVFHDLMAEGSAGVSYTSINFETHFLYGEDFTDGNLPIFLSYLIGNSENNAFPKIFLENNSLIKVKQIIDEMFEEFSEQQEGFVYCLRSLLVQLLVILGRNYSENYAKKKANLMSSRPYMEAIGSCIDYINNHFTDNIRLDDVVKLSMTSRTNFCKFFKIMTNTTFNEYVNNLRINYAKELLQYSEFGMTEIAIICGFADASGFSRKFKEITGIAPVTFRKRS